MEIFLMMTLWPDRAIATSPALILRDEKARWTVSTTSPASMIAPSTMASGDNRSSAALRS